MSTCRHGNERFPPGDDRRCQQCGKVYPTPTTTSFQRQVDRSQANVRRVHEQSAKRIPTEVLEAELARRQAEQQ